jgi:ribosomal protein S18 acetylase RimI-like enzyme
MNIEKMTDRDRIAEAADLAAAERAMLGKNLPWLPPRDASDYLPKLEWMAREGELLGLREDGKLVAFLGGFILDDFRNAGPGAYSPDWCHGAMPETPKENTVSSTSAIHAYRLLYRELAAHWVDRGIRIHAVSAYSTDSAALEALSLTGFGRIVMDAAAEATGLSRELAHSSSARGRRSAPSEAIAVRRATPADAAELAVLNARLAAHIGASPVLMPRTHGADEAEWALWLQGHDACCFIAERGGKAIAYIKAEVPQFDVTDAVHGERTLAINGLYASSEERRSGAATLLLAALAEEAVRRGMEVVSVDCETTNIEAYAFWSRHFAPVTWSFERRV